MTDNQDTERKKILLIDDDTSLLVTLSDFLKFEGYDVITAESAESGLERLKEISPDLIVLDMSMPGMGGIGFLEEISTNGTPSHPVLVLTARATMAEFFSQTQVDGFVAKPCNPADLLMEIGRIIFLRSGETETADELTIARTRSILLGEDRKEINDAIISSLEESGYSTETVFSGPDVLESAIVSKPDLIALRISLSGMNALAVTDVLSQMPNTRSIPVIVYGIDEEVADLELQAAVDENKIARIILDSNIPDLLKSITTLLPAEEE